MSTKTKITAPAGAFAAGTDGPGGLTFDEIGVAYTDNEQIIAYAKRHGYGIGSSDPVTPAPAPQPDARDVGGVQQVGTPLRDAAVDPKPQDFLPPTNAGKADPHGPLVVAPEIHASGTQVIRPGEVYVDDTAKQEKAETAQATKLLVEQQDAGTVTGAPESADRGPLGLSDPGSAEQGRDADTADTTGTTTPPVGTTPVPAKAPAKKATAKKAPANRAAKRAAKAPAKKP